METIKVILFFLNKLVFIEKVSGNIIEKFKNVKLRLVIEFENYNRSRLIQVLNIIDDLNIFFVIVDFQGVLDNVNSLRENNLSLISFKHCVGTNSLENDTSNFW